MYAQLDTKTQNPVFMQTEAYNLIVTKHIYGMTQRN